MALDLDLIKTLLVQYSAVLDLASDEEAYPWDSDDWIG